MTQKLSFWGFDKILIHSYIFLFEYESTNDSLLTFCTNCMSGSRVTIQKPLNQSEFRILYTTISHKRVEV